MLLWWHTFLINLLEIKYYVKDAGLKYVKRLGSEKFVG